MALALDPVAFACAAGIEPDPWQADLLTKRPRRALLCCSRQSGKSTTVAITADHVASFEPDSLTVIAAPSQRQSIELLRTVKGIHNRVGGLPEFINDSVTRIELENGSRIIALPGDGQGKTVRGLAAASLVIVDEAALCDEDLLAALRPMMATKAGARMIALSTPKGRRGWFFEAWHTGEGWERVRVPASMCPRITKEFLDEELRELGAARFSEEYELAFIDNESSAFPTDIIDRAFSHEVLPLWL